MGLRVLVDIELVEALLAASSSSSSSSSGPGPGGNGNARAFHLDVGHIVPAHANPMLLQLSPGYLPPGYETDDAPMAVPEPTLRAAKPCTCAER